MEFIYFENSIVSACAKSIDFTVTQAQFAAEPRPTYNLPIRLSKMPLEQDVPFLRYTVPASQEERRRPSAIILAWPSF